MFTLVLPALVFAQSGVELIIKKGTYRPRSNRYQFVLQSYVQNNSMDTIHIFYPYTSGFKSKDQMPAIRYTGEHDKPYEVFFEGTSFCVEMEEKVKPRVIKPKYLNLYPGAILVIPPGQRSKTIHSSFSASQTLCPEIDPKAKIIYEPNYEKLSKADRKFLMEKEKEFFALFNETEAYFEKEKLKTTPLNNRLTLAGTILRNYDFIEKLYTEKIISNQINLVIKK